MAKYICPQCSKAFIYCKGCALTPDLYKENGFCSKECYHASKIEIPEKVEVEPIEEEILTVETEPVEEEVFIEDEVSEEEEEILTEEVEIEFYENEMDIYEEQE